MLAVLRRRKRLEGGDQPGLLRWQVEDAGA
jgi:hypothetical protein